MLPHAFILEFQLKASIEEVMELLTDEDLIEAWSGGSSLIEKFEGGKFVMFDGWVEGKVMKITDDELAYTWKPSDWAEDTSPSSVHYKLIKDGDETKIILEHCGFPDKKEMENHKSGWTEHFFGPIEAYLANERGR